MEAVFIYIVKVNALLVLFFLVYQITLLSETFFKQSRWFLLSGLFLSILLPFITFTKIVYFEVKNGNNNHQFVENEIFSTEIVQEPILTHQEILFLVYGIVCFGFLIKTLLNFLKLYKIIKVSNSEKKNKLIYINTNLVQTPFSFFNYIVYNKEKICTAELQNIIKHEEAHSIQKHSFDTLIAQFFIILFWFNPIVWLYRKSIVQNLEFLADSFVIQQVSDRKMYQKTMLKIAIHSSKLTIINTFNQSSIKKRIIMLNKNQSNRKNMWKLSLIFPLLVVFIYFFQVKVEAHHLQTNDNFTKQKFENTKTNQNKSNFVVISNKFSTNEEMKKKSKSLENKSSSENSTKNSKRTLENDVLKNMNEKTVENLLSTPTETDTQPEPQNGMSEFRKFIANNFRLPEVQKDTDAMVVVKFMVAKTGEITSISIVNENPKNLGLGDEITRILNQSPKWKPGTKDGVPVDMYYVLPTKVQISASKN